MNRISRLLLSCALASLLAACGSLLGPKESPTLYAPMPRMAADPGWPAVDWRLGVMRPSAPRILDGARIAVRPVPGELQVYKGAMWASPPPDMLEDAVVRLLEDSGKLPAVARTGGGIGTEYRLLLDIRQFEADYAGGITPAAVIEVSAKLVHQQDHAIAGSRVFRQQVAAAGTDVATVADAFSQALGSAARDIAGWALASGEAHRQARHR